MRKEILSKDLKYIWHPYTQMKDSETLPPIPIERAEGVKLFDCDGNFYYDTISSWWCNVHGHNHPTIKKAIAKQMESFEHVLFAGFTHAPAVGLAERLVRITPANLTKVFYSDNGSTAVEVALKMSFQYWQNIGKPEKKTFLALDRAYHGDTIGAMSVSGVGLFNKKFESLFFNSLRAPAPYCYRCHFGKDKESCSRECLKSLENILDRNAKTLAAIIIEPILMAAGGMIVYPAEYLKKVWELSRKYNVHLIADEVATGFGRTGTMFALEHAGIEPDFLCLSKGITSGYLALGATLTTEKTYKAFYGDYDKFKTFYHGHTFTANPISCSAAAASIDLFDEEKTLENVKKISFRLSIFLKEMSELAIVGDARGIGTIAAFELVKNKKTKEPFGIKDRIGYEIYKRGLKKNLILRPIGDVVYLFLPLATKEDELEDILGRTQAVVESV